MYMQDIANLSEEWFYLSQWGLTFFLKLCFCKKIEDLLIFFLLHGLSTSCTGFRVALQKLVNAFLFMGIFFLFDMIMFKFYFMFILCKTRLSYAFSMPCIPILDMPYHQQASH